MRGRHQAKQLYTDSTVYSNEQEGELQCAMWRLPCVETSKEGELDGAHERDDSHYEVLDVVAHAADGYGRNTGVRVRSMW